MRLCCSLLEGIPGFEAAGFEYSKQSVPQIKISLCTLPLSFLGFSLPGLWRVDVGGGVLQVSRQGFLSMAAHFSFLTVAQTFVLHCSCRCWIRKRGSFSDLFRCVDCVYILFVLCACVCNLCYTINRDLSLFPICVLAFH